MTMQGRPFAWQEAQLVLVTVIQNFDLYMHDPTYELALKQTLTIKPNNFFIHAIPRKSRPRLLAIPSSSLLSTDTSAATALHSRETTTTSTTGDDASRNALYVLYGSNTGTSESFAQRLASAAPAHGTNNSMT